MTNHDPLMMVYAIQLLFSIGDTVEVRALKVQGYGNSLKTWFGYFFYDGNNAQAIVNEILKLAPAKGIYFTLNPVDPNLRARSNNKMTIAETGNTTGDQDILSRRHLLIDIDSVRKSDTSATDALVQLAYAIALQIYNYLTNQGWPQPIICFSGNGFHLLYPVDLPCNDNGLVKNCLESLAMMFDTAEVKVDTCVFNPARIVRFYGTVARKGDPVPELTIHHRVSKIISTPTQQGTNE